MRRLAAILCFICFLCGRLVAFTRPAPVDLFWENVKISIHSHTVYSMKQDRKGMVWIGTNYGLYNFDGYHPQAHFHADDISNSQIYSIVEDGQTLYLGTNNGLLKFDTATNEYTMTNGTPSEIRTMIRTDNVLWIGSLNGLYRHHIDTGKTERIESGLPHHAVYALMRTATGDIYIGTYNGLCRYDEESKCCTLLPIDPTHAGNNLFVNSLVEDARRHCLWIGTEGSLLKYEPVTGHCENIPPLEHNSVKSLAIDHQGNIVIGTDNGFFIYDDTHIVQSRHDSRMSHSLADNVVWSVMVDNDNNLWAGTEADFSVLSNSDDFHIIPLSKLTRKVDGNHIYSMLRDSRGNLWIGGTNGIIKYSGDPSTSLWFMPGSDSHPLTHNRVRHIYEDHEGNVWIATDGGIDRYDFRQDRFVNYRLYNKSRTLNANWAYSILEDAEGRIWVGSYLGGILIADQDKLKNTTTGFYEADGELNTANGMPNNFINQMIEDGNGNKWVLLFRNGTLLKIERERNILKQIDVEKEVGAFPYFLICDSYNNIWCGFHGGMARIDTDGQIEKIVRFPSRKGDNLLAMAQVGDEIWASTTNGVWAINIQTGKHHQLPLPDNSYTSIYYDTAKDAVLLGYVDQLLKVNPNISRRKTRNDSIYITSLLVNDTPLMPHDTSPSSPVRLKHNENNLNLKFSTLNYALNNRRRYEYRLAGQDDSWTMLPKDDNAIALKRLEPRHYRLEIRQANAGEDTAICVFPFVIRPAWYQSWWANLSYVVLALLLAWWAFSSLRMRVRLRMERIERDRTLAAVKSRIDFLTHTSHEFKTPLSMIIGPLSKILGEIRNETLRHSLNIVYQNAMHLNTMVQRALEMNRMDTTDKSLLIYSLVNITEFCRSIFDTYIEAHPEKHFIFSSDTEQLATEIDAVKFESVLNNLLSNACKYSEDGATIALSVITGDSSFTIRISDDGVGIPAHEHQLIFHRMYRSARTADSKEGTGIGLYLVKQYISMHQGTIEVESTENVGTTFTVVIPFHATELSTDNQVRQPAKKEDGRPIILIVDDNMAISSFIQEVLSTEYQCITASNGRAGLAVCNSITPSLIIADEMMPVMDGLEMCRRIKANPQLAIIPILMLTAKDDKTTEAESLKAGIDQFMAKPFEAPILEARVKNMLSMQTALKASIRMEQLTAPKPVEAESATEKQMAQLTQTIEDNIADPNLNVSFVCEKMNMQSKQLYRMVKKYTGVSPVDHIRQIRLRKAAMLLEQKKFSVSEIMYMVGFSSSSYFSKCFHAQFGCTPKQYAETKE